MSTIDLHVHSNFSDGTDSLERIFEMAKEKNINTIAITDHDNIDGLPLANKLANKHNIHLIYGTELTGIYEDDEFHILCYGFQLNDPIINELTLSIRNERNKRNIKLIKNFNDIGIPMTIEKLNKGNEKAIITRGNIASYLVENGYAKDWFEAFSKYLGPNSKTFVKKSGISAKDCISQIKKGEAISILAHPNLYKISSNFEYHLKKLIDYGLDGIECYHSTYSDETTQYYLAMAKKYNLLITGGSDYHGRGKKHVKLGTGEDNLNIQEKDVKDFLDVIKKS